MKNLIAILILLLSTTAYSDERILSFHSDVRIFTDGMIEVTETIQVRAEGQQIRRGIYRDFPTEYEDRLGNSYEITVEPLAVLRNELPEPFHTVRSGRDIRMGLYPGQYHRADVGGEDRRCRLERQNLGLQLVRLQCGDQRRQCRHGRWCRQLP
jgi:hypothetical protein